MVNRDGRNTGNPCHSDFGCKRIRAIDELIRHAIHVAKYQERPGGQ